MMWGSLVLLQSHIAFIFHHVFSMMTWPVGISYRACHWFLLVCVSMEASTPFVQGRWFISQHGMRESSLYMYNGLAMMFVFFGRCRSATTVSSWQLLLTAVPSGQLAASSFSPTTSGPSSCPRLTPRPWVCHQGCAWRRRASSSPTC
jgi:hypothetical protein